MPSNPAFAIQLCFFYLTCAADLLEKLYSGRSGQRGALIRGRFRGPQANRFRPIFQVLFYCSRLFAGSAVQACNVVRHSPHL